MADDVAARAIAVIAEHSGMDAAQITRDTALDELGVDSMKLTEIVMDIEEAFDIEIDLNAAEAWESHKNVGSLVDAVGALVRARG